MVSERYLMSVRTRSPLGWRGAEAAAGFVVGAVEADDCGVVAVEAEAATAGLFETVAVDTGLLLEEPPHAANKRAPPSAKASDSRRRTRCLRRFGEVWSLRPVACP
jgi:hypothetical protein